MSVQVRFDNVVAVYDTFIGRWTRTLMPAVIRAAGVTRGQRVLDLATGTGESALMLADAVGPTGTVTGADISMPMLRAAASKLKGGRIRLAAMDGQSLAWRSDIFHAVVCQLGLMFFPDPVAGAREARRALREGGRFAALVWSAPERVPWFGLLARELLEQFPDRHAQLLQGASLGDAARLERVLVDAGFRDVTVAAETHAMEFAAFDAYWSHVESGAIRIGLMLADLPGATVAAIRDRLRGAMAAFASRGRLVVPAEVLVAVGTK